jgi:hypothetical protein
MVDTAVVAQMRLMVRAQNNMLETMNKMVEVNQKVAASIKDMGDEAEETEKKLTVFGKVAGVIAGKRLEKFRRILYGFGAEGLFRGINKVVASLEQMDNVVRGVRTIGGGKGKFLNFLNPNIDFTKFDKITSQIKGAQKAQEIFFNRSNTARLRMRGIASDPDEAERNLMGAQRAESGLRGERTKELFSMITGIRKREEKMGSGVKKRAKQFADVLQKTDFGKIFGLIKKHVIRAAILFSAVVFKAVAFIVIFYLLFKAFGPAVMEALKTTWDAIKVVGKIALAGLMVVWDGLQDIWSAFFGDGDLTTLIDGLLKVAGGLLLFVAGIAITALSAALVLLGSLVVETVKRIGDGIAYYFSSAMSWANRVAVTIGLIAGTIAFIVSGAWAAMIAAAIGFYVAKKIAGVFGFFADGGTVTSPLQIVGERGPELVSLPRGSRVHNNTQSKRMAASGGNTFNITINARDTSDAELRRIADKIGQMVSGRINRNTSSRTLGA